MARLVSLVTLTLLLLIPAQISADTIFDDHFYAFDTDTWSTAEGVNGLPDLCMQATVDERDCLWMKSLMNPYERRGIQSDRAFHLTSARAEVVFKPVSGGIDGSLQFLLNSPSTGKEVGIMVFGGSYGVQRTVNTLGSFNNSGSPANQWNYDQWYRFIIDATGPKVQVSMYCDNGDLVWSYTFDCSLSDIGPDIRLCLIQYMGIPKQPWESKVAIDRVTLIGEGMPVVGASNKSACDTASRTARDIYRFRIWGKAKAVDGGIELDDGSGNPIMVSTPLAPGFFPGDVLCATGLLDTYSDKTTLHCVSGDITNLSR